MSEQDPRERNPRERPPDPAGTRPRHDPESLLPATREPLLSDDVVEERETDRDDLLPARRRPGGAAEAVAPARHSQYAPRFHFLTGALAAVGIAALVGLAVFIALPGGGQDPGPRWSTWTPDVKGNAGAQQIAEHVGPAYKLPDGHQMVDVSVTGLEIEGVPLAVAVREAPTQGGDIRVFDDRGLIYRLCGLGPDCAIATGKPSEERHLLLRREALELALYTFRYIKGVDQVVALLPPAPPAKPKKGAASSSASTETPTQALFFRPGDLEPQLEIPLGATIPPQTPRPETIAGSEARRIDALTRGNLFLASFQQSQDQKAYLVLDRLPQ
jgi:hypothetical protein